MRARPRIGASFEIALPSGAKGTVRALDKRHDDGRKPRDLGEALALGALDTALEVHALPLADANVLEAVLAAMTVIGCESAKLECRNCGEHFEADAAAALPIAPLLVPQGDPELDPVVDRAEWHELPAPIEVARRGHVDHFHLARRTFSDRLKLEDLLGDDASRPLPLGAPLVRALGLDALGRGEEALVKSPMAIARMLMSLDDDSFDEVWAAICNAYDRQHWPPRLLAPVACPKCSARHDIEAVTRPLEFVPVRSEVRAEFPELAEFRARAAQITREVFKELGLEDPRGLEVIVDDDVPPCDDGGEPLLGSYTPNLNADGDVRVQSSPFVIALYYRTFRSMYADEPYDVEGEIRETVEHELEHHLGFVEGDDPLDDEERKAIETERRRLVGGSNATDLAAGAGWLASDFGRFIRVTWPIWALVLFGLLLVLAGGR